MKSVTFVMFFYMILITLVRVLFPYILIKICHLSNKSQHRTCREGKTTQTIGKDKDNIKDRFG